MKRRQVVLATGALSTTALAGCLDSNAEGPGDTTGGTERVEFDVGIESFEQEVKQGDEVSIHFSVENSGERDGTQTIQFKVNDSVVDSIQDIQLQSGESFNDNFTYTTGTGDSPEITLEIATNQESTARTITVDPRPPVEALNTRISDVRNVSPGLTSATVPVYLEFENTHAEQEIPSPTVEYTGYINGAEVVSNRQIIASIEPGDAVTEEFGFAVQYTKLGGAIVTAIQEGSFTVRMTGTVESEDTTVEFDESYEY